MSKTEDGDFALKQARTYKPMTTNLLTWLAVHGNLCLALRHPRNVGASRPFVVKFVKDLGKKLVEWGAITEEQLKYAERIEIEEGSTDLR